MRISDDILGRMPPTELLETVAPIPIWWAAMAQALRSPNRRHRTGAVIFEDGKVLAKGTAYPVEDLKVRSVHAERDAIAYWQDKNHGECLIVTLTRVGNFAQVSRPCIGCADALDQRGIEWVVFAEKANDGSWVVRREPPCDLLNGKPTRYRR